MTPEILQILQQAADHPDGQISIERPTQGGWPEGLRQFRLLEKERHLLRIVTRVSSTTSTVTAIYQITDIGRRAIAKKVPEDPPYLQAARRRRAPR